MVYNLFGLMIYFVKMLENRLFYEIDWNYNFFNICIIGRELDFLVILFRMDLEVCNYCVM